jgi:hypothetical protein
MISWIKQNLFFINIGKYWKGIYIHFLPKYCYRIFYSYNKFGHDKYRKAKYE